MKNIASNRLEDWLEDDEDINQNLDFKEKSFYTEDESTRSFRSNIFHIIKPINNFFSFLHKFILNT